MNSSRGSSLLLCDLSDEFLARKSNDLGQRLEYDMPVAPARKTVLPFEIEH